MESYTTRELTKEEGEALTKDMQAVLEKHGAEMGVVSSITLLKRILKDIKTPYLNGEPNTTEEKPDSETEKSSEGDSGESA